MDTNDHGDRAEHARPRALLRWLFRSSETGQLAIVQIPNLPLTVFLVATGVRLAWHPAGSVGTAVSVISSVAILWWAVDEIARGDSPFRRILGALVLAGVVLGLVTR